MASGQKLQKVAVINGGFPNTVVVAGVGNQIWVARWMYISGNGNSFWNMSFFLEDGSTGMFIGYLGADNQGTLVPYVGKIHIPDLYLPTSPGNSLTLGVAASGVGGTGPQFVQCTLGYEAL